MSDPRELKPRLRPGLDLTKAGLSLDEGILASRIDGHTTVRELAHLVGKPPEAIDRIVRRLLRAGVVSFGEAPADSSTDSLDLERPDYGDFVFPPSLMMEEGDLDEADRKKIIYVFEHLEKWNHYELLQARRKDDDAAIKRAYHARSMEWHPDRFRHKQQLGSFQRMLTEIFKRIQSAHKELSDPKRRKAYDEGNVLMAGEDEIAEMLALQRKEERERRRQADKIARRKRNNPMRAVIEKARGFYEEAQKKREEGAVLDALRQAQLAKTYDEHRPEYHELVATLEVEAAELRIEPLMKRGRSLEGLTHYGPASELFEEAVRLAPEHGPARLRLAYNLVMRPHGAQDGSTHALKAVQLLPDEPEAHFVLGLCYEKGGKTKAAIRSLQKAVELKPNYKEAKKRLRELKWGF